MSLNLERVYNRLFELCKSESFAGFDPFDGLNSRLFQMLPLKHSYYSRLAWLQLLKRGGTNLRKSALVPKGVNPKAIALFALAELARFRKTGDEDHAENAKALLNQLLTFRIVFTEASGVSAYGYNFDWQSRVFFAPKNTPAIVPTAFAHQAFSEAFELFADQRYADVCHEICNFIVLKLNRPVNTADAVCFSYTQLDSEIIYNASLLAAECLARTGAGNHKAAYINLAEKAARFVLSAQSAAGAWAYGEDAKQSWVDNFHTAYVLLSIYRISVLIPNIRAEIEASLQRGIDFWLANFFLDDGTPKYYNNAVFPVDIHSAAVAIAALSELSSFEERLSPFAVKVADWTIENMRSPEGFFYYRKNKNSINRTPYMRWGQAWLAYGLGRLLEAEIAKNN